MDVATMPEWLGSTVVPAGIFVLGIMVSVIGYLIHSRVVILDQTAKETSVAVGALNTEISTVKTSLAEAKTTQAMTAKHVDGCLQDFCDRLGRVEEHVSNTERLVQMESKVNAHENEIANIRQDHHELVGKLNDVMLKLAVARTEKA